MKNRQGIVWAPVLIMLGIVVVTGVTIFWLIRAGNTNESSSVNIAVVNQTNNNSSTRNLNTPTNRNTDLNTNSPLGQPKILEHDAVVTDGVVTITWRTDKPTDGLVEIGETTEYIGPILTPIDDNGNFDASTLNKPRPKMYSMQHSVKMFVGNNKTYHYKIQSCAEDIIDQISGCITSPDYTFST